VSPGRLTGRAQADLHQYAQLVRRLGRGTGKYADRRRADIRKAMDRCRTAVPVWIMPIYRIAEQLRVAPNMFDLVVVDEASQAGLEATFLQYLAPKMVVIGDDKQVSPAAVGVDQQQLRDLANQYLGGDRYKASWEDPKRSLFDEAVMRYGRRITLTEHRRCVPEIIGFSNRIAYEPDGIRLVPVRQYGTDRLDPIKTIYTADGYERGSAERINPVEVDAVVDQIEKCLSDPRYHGKTFGVISLLGSAQAKAIEKKLLYCVPPEEWAARDLRCGDAADFQGSERDVMFLSMVATAEPGRRLGALTQEQHLQRYNVAVSRARDQLWLAHSLQASDVSNPQDLRRVLLDYCYGVVGIPAKARPAPVPEDVVVSPFESLFEQRVFNRIVDRGYAATAQVEANGYRIDIVVEGAKRRLGVVCHGDAWRGPARYARDLARERDLERCGWQFHRIRESEFYVDQERTLARLWDALEQAEIFPPHAPVTRSR
jgi:very-short-patch-repair endonuclease